MSGHQLQDSSPLANAKACVEENPKVSEEMRSTSTLTQDAVQSLGRPLGVISNIKPLPKSDEPNLWFLVWEGLLVSPFKCPLCKLKAYYKGGPSGISTSDWPSTMVALNKPLPQGYMKNLKNQARAELLLFIPELNNTFVAKLAKTQMCVGIRLPSQVLVLGHPYADEPHQLVGMLFPKDITKAHISTKTSPAPTVTPIFDIDCVVQGDAAQAISTQSYSQGLKPCEQSDMQQKDIQHVNTQKETNDNDLELYEYIKGSVRFNYPDSELLPTSEPKEDPDFNDFLGIWLA